MSDDGGIGFVLHPRAVCFAWMTVLSMAREDDDWKPGHRTVVVEQLQIRDSSLPGSHRHGMMGICSIRTVT